MEKDEVILWVKTIFELQQKASEYGLVDEVSEAILAILESSNGKATLDEIVEYCYCEWDL